MRELTSNERAILARLLEPSFAGRDILARQLKNALVTELDSDGSLKFHTQSAEKAGVKARVPVEAECEDSDGVTIHFLLHVVDGTIDELEIYKVNSSPVVRKPDASELRVVPYPPGRWPTSDSV